MSTTQSSPQSERDRALIAALLADRAALRARRAIEVAS